jgi:hypothetical protein
MRITPAFAFSYVERAIQEGLGRRAFGALEMDLVGAFFGEPLRCVYCDGIEVQRWDHLVPVFSGGETVIGNMVPACGRCDDTKRQVDFATWLRGRAERNFIPPQSAEDRIRHLQEYAARFGYQPPRLDGRLTAERKAQLSELRSRILALRRDIEDFIRAGSP